MRIKIKYTAGNPPVECEQTHDFPEAPTFIEIDAQKMEVWVTVAERKVSAGHIERLNSMWSKRRTLYIAPEINTPLIPTPFMTRDPFDELRKPVPRRSWWQRVKTWIFGGTSGKEEG